MAKQTPIKLAAGSSNFNTRRVFSSMLSFFMQKETWGIESIHHLMTNECENIPNKEGIFLILTSYKKCPGFITEVQARERYKFNFKNPQTLTNKITKAGKSWVDKSCILFIGETKRKGLRGRIQKFIDFGKGKSCDRCGGWFVWLLKCLCHILILWIALPEECDPKLFKKHLLKDFKKYYGNLPYANERI